MLHHQRQRVSNACSSKQYTSTLAVPDKSLHLKPLRHAHHGVLAVCTTQRITVSSSMPLASHRATSAGVASSLAMQNEANDVQQESLATQILYCGDALLPILRERHNVLCVSRAARECALAQQTYVITSLPSTPG